MAVSVPGMLTPAGPVTTRPRAFPATAADGHFKVIVGEDDDAPGVARDAVGTEDGTAVGLVVGAEDAVVGAEDAVLGAEDATLEPQAASARPTAVSTTRMRHRVAAWPTSISMTFLPPERYGATPLRPQTAGSAKRA
jgi:hypothetical protein